MEALGATVLSVVLTAALQEALNAIHKTRIKQQVEASVKSIKLANIDGVIDQIQGYQRRNKDTREAWRNNIAEWRRLLCEIQDCVDNFNINIKQRSPENFAPEIQRLGAEFEQQSKTIKAYIQDHDGNPCDPLPGVPDSPNKHAGRKLKIVGIKEARNDLLALVRNFKKQLETRADDSKLTKVISIVGAHGVGKTCLSSQVYFRRRLRKSFPLRAFVSVTDKKNELHKDNVLNEVLEKLHRHGPGCTEQDPRSCLRSTNKRCFIVVDDVHDVGLGSAVIREFRDVTKVDGIIILTTTVQSFAQRWSRNNGHVYKMMPLSAQLSRTLFTGHYHGQNLPASEEFGEGYDDGVPLAVTTWANYCNDEDPQLYKTVWSKFGVQEWHDTLETMERVLKHSYDSLADHDLQTSLLYFSLFLPENRVSRGSLIRRWQAEGAEVGCLDDSSLRVDGIDKWKKLVDRNLLCPVQVSINEEDQGAKKCRSSGAMHGYIMSHNSRSEQGFARVCSDGVWPRQVIRRLSLQTHKADGLTVPDKVSRLRTLLVSPGNNNDNNAADLSLDKCRLLRVLDLEQYGGQISLKEEVCKKLKFLRYLSLRSELIRDSIGQEIIQLKVLQTLDVGKKEVVKVHADVLLLPNLKHLVGKIQILLTTEFKLWPRMYKAKKLVTLAGFVTLHGEGFPKVIQYMVNLRKVKVFFDPKASTKSLSDRLAKAITSFLHEHADHSKEHERRSLSIYIPNCEEPTIELLGSLENAKGTLYSLKLCGSFKLPSLPSFIHEDKLMGIEKLIGIEKLCISFDTLSWQAIINGENRLPHLKYLKLVAKGGFPGGVPNQPTAGQRAVTEVLRIKVNQFKNLKRMCLQSAKFLPKIEIDVGALTSLVSLHLISWGIGNPTEVICKRNPTNGIPPVNNPNQVAHDIVPLNMLKEIALQSSSPVNVNIKKAWHEAARSHPNSPQVLFI